MKDQFFEPWNVFPQIHYCPRVQKKRVHGATTIPPSTDTAFTFPASLLFLFLVLCFRHSQTCCVGFDWTARGSRRYPPNYRRKRPLNLFTQTCVWRVSRAPLTVDAYPPTSRTSRPLHFGISLPCYHIHKTSCAVFPQDSMATGDDGVDCPSFEETSFRIGAMVCMGYLHSVTPHRKLGKSGKRMDLGCYQCTVSWKFQNPCNMC